MPTFDYLLKLTATAEGMERLDAVSRGLRSIAQHNNAISRATKQAEKGVQSFGQRLQGAIGVAKGMNNQMLNMMNSVRLVGQGMMSAGKAMTFFISAPLILMLKGASEAAIGFDDALVRVQKTTELSRKGMAQLTVGLREVARTTVTSHTDLAKMAEQIGQLGVRGVPQILELTKIFNMLTVTTDISADSVSQDIGRIANAFNVDLDTEEGVEQIRRFANVINELENQIAVTAPEIIDGMSNFAQVGSTLFADMSEKSLTAGAALVSTLVSVGFSSEEAGNGLRNLSLKMVQNIDVLTQLLGAQERYNSEEKIAAAITEDFGTVLTDLLIIAGNSENAMLQLSGMFELAGIRGGKAGATLAEVWEQMAKNLNIANMEWKEATSLLQEYERALLSTQSQLKVMRNNLNDLAITFGETLLPVINQVIQHLIPVIRTAIVFFDGLSDNIKISIVAFTGLAIILGPILLFLGQLIFAGAMISIAFLRVGTTVLFLAEKLVVLGGLLKTIVGGIAAALSISASWSVVLLGGLVSAIGLLIIKLFGLGETVADFFTRLAERAHEWGFNLAATLGKGILAGAVQVITKVLVAVANIIAGFLRAFSPPKEGPLKHIDKWGENLMDTYLKSFLNADFGILSQVGSAIESIFKNFSAVGKIGETDQFAFAMEARQHLSELIAIFNDTGQVAEDVLSKVVENLGAASDEVEQLIRLWLEYNRIQESLRKLEKQREGVLDTYRQEVQLIAQSNMSAEEKAQAIRDAMMSRDDELRSIEEQEDALEDELDIVQEQLEFQQEMIKAMQHQDDLEASLLSKLDAIGNALSGMEFPEFEMGDFAGLGDLQDVTGGLTESILTLEDRIKRAGLVWQAFLAGFSGENFEINLEDFLTDEEMNWARKLGLDQVDPELAGIIERAEHFNGLGMKAGDIWEGISGSLSTIAGFLDQVSSEGLMSAIMGGGEGGGGDIAESGLARLWQTEFETIGTLMEGPVAEFKLALEGLGEAWDNLVAALEGAGVGDMLVGLFGFLGTVDWATIVGGINGIIVGLIGRGVVQTITQIVQIMTVWFNIIAFVANFIRNLVTNAVVGFGIIKEVASRAWEGLKEKVAEAVENVLAWWENLKSGSSEKFEAIKETISGVWEDIRAKAGEVWDGIISFIGEKVDAIKEIFSPIADAFIEVWNNFLIEFGPIWEDIILIVATVWERIKTWAITKWTEIVTGIMLIVGGIITLLTPIWEGIVTFISGVWENIKILAIIGWTFIKVAISNAWEGIASVVQEKVDRVKAIVSFAWNAIKTAAKIGWILVKAAIAVVWNTIITLIGTKVEAVKTKVLGFIDDFKEIGRRLIQGIADGIKGAGNALVNAAAGSAQAAINAIKNMLGISSPSRVMIEFGMQTIEGFAKGIQMADALLKTEISASAIGGLATSSPLSPSIPSGGFGGITVQINNPVVREDADINRLADAVGREIARRTKGNMAMGHGF